MCKCDVKLLEKFPREAFEYKTYPDGRLKRPLCPICRKFLNIVQVHYLEDKGIL